MTTDQAREQLAELLPAGSTAYTVLRHVSRSGMSRDIDVIAIVDGEPRWVSGMMCAAFPRYFSRYGNRDAIRVGGCGMDMGFHLVDTLSRALYGEGYKLQHRWI